MHYSQEVSQDRSHSQIRLGRLFSLIVGLRETVQLCSRRPVIEFVYYQEEADELGNVAFRSKVGRETVVLESRWTSYASNESVVMTQEAPPRCTKG